MVNIEAVKEILVRFGTIWVLWLLVGLSVVSVLVIIERLLLYRAAEGDLEDLARGLDARLSQNDYGGALTLLRASSSVAASITSAGLRLAHLGPKAVEKAMQSATALEKTRLERWLAYLGTVGNNAPFIGLFGTVIGIIEAFEHLSEGSKAAAGQAASQAVMSSIAEALVTTAIGILVALPAVAFYNYLQRRVASLLSGTEALSTLLLAYLEEPNRTFPKVGE
jgi:biopolymer transport protein ExbB